jgi:hypothetical protein
MARIQTPSRNFQLLPLIAEVVEPSALVRMAYRWRCSIAVVLPWQRAPQRRFWNIGNLQAS